MQQPIAILLLAWLPVAAAAEAGGQIEWQIEVGENGEVSSKTLGRLAHAITEDEMRSFGIHWAGLASGFDAVFGRKPDTIALGPPTPWDDAQGSPWDRYPPSRPVRTVVDPVQTRVVGRRVRQMTLRTARDVNHAPNVVRFCETLGSTVSETVASTWASTLQLGFNGGFIAQVGFRLLAGLGVSVTTEWGESKTVSRGREHDTASKACICAAPGHAYRFELKAMHGTVEVEQQYKASVDGDALGNYTEPLDGHHWRFLDAAAIMRSLGLPESIDGVQKLDIGYFTDSSIDVYDETLQQSVQALSPFGASGC